MKIAITGATGQLGQFIIDTLLKETAEQNIIALVRDLNKAESIKNKGIELRHFNYDVSETLIPALQGVDKLLLISSNNIGHRVSQHQAIIDAAKQAKVPYIAYTSILHADYSPLAIAQEHRETEALIKKSGLVYTLLRNNWYHENYLRNIPQTAEIGILYGAAKDGQISSASRQDYAEAAAKVLVSSHHNNKTYELAGSTSFTLTQLAQYIAEATNAPIIYQNLSAQDYAKGLTEAGLSSELIEIIVDADIQTAQGAMLSNSTDLETLIGRRTTTIQQQIQMLLT